MIEQISSQTVSQDFPILLSYSFFGNTIFQYVIAIGSFILFLILFKIIQLLILRYFKKLADRTETDIDDTIVEVVKGIKPPFYLFVAFYGALSLLTLHVFLKQAIDVILIVWIVYQAVHVVEIVIDFGARKILQKDKEKDSQATVGFLTKSAKGLLWVFGFLLILSNLGIDITSLIAGLGIGGVAVALAAQNILTDLFSSFAIYFDKPFVVGDFIVIGEHKGTVEKIGIKTTRLRSLQGEELVISNQELTSIRIQNYKTMKERRVTFSFGVVYETPVLKLKKINGVVKKIIEAQKYTRFDRIHFSSFGDSSLDFDVVYFMETADYKKFKDTQQKINLSIMEVFEEMRISFAYPTHTVYLQKNSF